MSSYVSTEISDIIVNNLNIFERINKNYFIVICFAFVKIQEYNGTLKLFFSSDNVCAIFC